MQYKKDRRFHRNRVVGKTVKKELEIYFRELTIQFNLERGRRIANVRAKLKISQAELAEKLGLTQTDIHRLEHGMLSTIPMTAAQFRSALPDDFDYVLMGHHKHKYEEIKRPTYAEMKAKRRKC